MGYSVVGEFITQAETAEHISEVLQQLRNWNPMWNPQFFMADYSEAELLALEQSFPSVQIYLRDFHRKEAWERWTTINMVSVVTKRNLFPCYGNVQMLHP